MPTAADLIAAILTHPHRAAALVRYAREFAGERAGRRFAKAFDEKLHPRDRDGHFIALLDIADAAGDPEMRDALRKRVKDPADLAKLDAAFEASMADDTYRTPAERAADAKAAAKAPAKAEWDGKIASHRVDESTASGEHVADWNYNDRNGGDFPQTVRVVAGTYDPDPGDPDSDPVDVYRWESGDENGVSDRGKWTVDEDAATADGKAFGAKNHTEPAEESDVDEPDTDEDADDEDDADEPAVPTPEPRRKRDVTLGATPLPKSQATVRVADAIDEPHADRVVESIFSGDDYGGGYGSLIDCVGMPDDAELRVTAAGKYVPLYIDDLPMAAVGVRVTVTHPQLGRCSRFVGVDAAGKRFIKNEIIEVKAEFQGNGLGATIFARQVESASQEGVDYLTTHAAGRKGHAMNGYITWPKFGYDMSLTDGTGIAPEDADAYAAAREAFPAAKTVLDILGTKGGKEWWTENGRDMGNARFDLNPGSRSMTVMAAYLAEKAAKKAVAA